MKSNLEYQVMKYLLAMSECSSSKYVGIMKLSKKNSIIEVLTAYLD